MVNAFARLETRMNQGAGYAHMLRACLSEEGISPGQLNVDKKTNEITVFPKCLDMLNIKGCIFISGVMGCQKEIVHKIIQDKKPSYILVVKDNQKNLHEHIFETEKMLQTSCTYKEIDADHGRIEERYYEIYRDLSFVNAAWNWENLSALVVVESRRYNKRNKFRASRNAAISPTYLAAKAKPLHKLSAAIGVRIACTGRWMSCSVKMPDASVGGMQRKTFPF